MNSEEEVSSMHIIDPITKVRGLEQLKAMLLKRGEKHENTSFE